MENKQNIRCGDKKVSPYRSGRFYSIANEWYFSVRESKDQGPYPSKLAAEDRLKTYLLDREHFAKNKISNLRLV